jgi:hypothetical protein
LKAYNDVNREIDRGSRGAILEFFGVFFCPFSLN